MNLRIRVKKCVDSDEFVWSLIESICGFVDVVCDGYEASESEAWEKAKLRRIEELNYLNGV